MLIFTQSAADKNKTKINKGKEKNMHKFILTLDQGKQSQHSRRYTVF